MYLSKCCHTETGTHMCADFPGDNPKDMRIGTCWFSCEKCKKPCDVILDEKLVLENE